MRIRNLLSAALLVLLLAACAPSFATAPGGPAARPAQTAAGTTTLTVYARVTDSTRDVETRLIKEFEARHNVKVNLVSADDSKLYQRFVVEEQNGQETADVFAGWNPVGVLQLEQQGRLQAYVPPALAGRIPARFTSPVVIQHTGLSAIAYNPQKLGSNPPPVSYADLADSRYQDRIEMVAPILSSTYLKLVGHIALSTPLGWDYWARLHANGVRLVGTTYQVNKDIEDPASPIVAGIVGYGTAYPDERGGKAIKVVIPAEGLIASEYVVAIATHARHPDLARAFVEEVTFNPALLEAWSALYLPVTVTGVRAPAGTPPLDRIVMTDWKLLQDKELEIRTQWQSLLNR
jgi:iron(III) transport system substrate-binding protein